MTLSRVGKCMAARCFSYNVGMKFNPFSSKSCGWVLALFIAIAGRPALALECGIASAHPAATRAGCEILASGGNAFDAAVAVAAALAVVEPFASGLGGGGFFLLHRAADSKDIFVDARETAPLRATAAFFTDEKGEAKQKVSLDGATAAGIPGEPAALDWLAKRYGKLPLANSLLPAIGLAEQGFEADSRYVWAAKYREAQLKSDSRTSRIFLDGGMAVAAGFRVTQPELAMTLRTLAKAGAQGFYKGALAREMVKAVQTAGGLWELADLEAYRIVEREPLKFRYRDAWITTAPLPSSGGLVLAQCLFILESQKMAALSNIERAHWMVEAMRRGYHDRARYMGDPDFVTVPVERLFSRRYALARGASIRSERATPSSALAELSADMTEGADTTHFSVIDAEGNRVAATLSVNGPFGAGFIAGDSGVLLNNHMNDFVLVDKTPNQYRLTGGAANRIEPGKRPLSSMSPTFVEDERGVLVLGTPGGSRIISMVLQAIVDYVDGVGPALEQLVSAPRYHHQYLPDRIEYEPGGFGEKWVADLQARGHLVEAGRRKWGNMQIVHRDKKNGQFAIANDPRGLAGVLF
jgi:gamma-glutamyltranspeptidase / glutathione hydrolase